MKNETMEINVPFGGFYESHADGHLEFELEQMLADDRGEQYEHLVNRARDTCDWRAVYRDYAQLHVEALSSETELPSLTFKRLDSPREYNFATDTIDATITRDDLAKMIRETDKKTLVSVCIERHTSCSGFWSFYDPDYTTWGRISTWDHNQLGSLLLAYIETQGIDCDEIYLIDAARGNGELMQILEDHIPQISKLYEIAYLLNNRTA